MGGQRTKKGTRKSGAHQKKSNTPCAFIDPKKKNLTRQQERWADADLETTHLPSVIKQMEKVTNAPYKYYSTMSEDEIRYNWDVMKKQHISGTEICGEEECRQMSQYIQDMNVQNNHKALKGYLTMSTPEDQLVELKDTGDIGMGVFAYRDLLEGEVVTLYPSHYHAETRNGMDHWICPPHVSHEDAAIFLEREGRKYIMSSRYFKYVGDPQEVDKWWLLGHMINDRGYDGTLDYKPMIPSNCAYWGSQVRVTKFIKKGDELSVPYSSPYWFVPSDYLDGKTWHELTQEE
tara:strand:+ start:282 stop:1151 length:870 start_codon:yes stop_codon:yes gene_type:complete